MQKPLAPYLKLFTFVSLLSSGTVQLENGYSFILKVTLAPWQSRKRVSININHEYYLQPSQVSLNWSSGSVLMTPIEKDGVHD